MKYLVSLFCVLLVICSAPIGSLAADKVVVIPLMSHQSKPLKNVVTVAKKNGDFTDPVAAVNSITDAAADNPYLIVIAPGVYTLTEILVMKRYVSITGSGEDVTILTGVNNANRCYSGAIVKQVAKTILSNITVINTGGGGDGCASAIAVSALNIENSTILKHVTAKAQGARLNAGITLRDKPTLLNVLAQAQGGEWSVGIWTEYRSRPKLFNVTARAFNGSDKTCGIEGSDSSTLLLTNVTVLAKGGKNVIGISFYSPEYAPILKEVTVTASGGAVENVGIYYWVYNHFPPITIQRSSISGTTYSLQLYDANHEGVAKAYISQSTMFDGVHVESSDGFIKCVACDDGQGNALNNNCNL